MKLVLVVLVAALCSGCINRMTNDAIIAEATKCEQVGYPWRQSFNYDGTVKDVYCANYGPMGPQMKRVYPQYQQQ